MHVPVGSVTSPTERACGKRYPEEEGGVVDSAEPGLSRLGRQEEHRKGDGNASLRDYLETTRTL